MFYYTYTPPFEQIRLPIRVPIRLPIYEKLLVPQTAAPAYAEASGGQARCRGGGLTGVAFSPHGGFDLPARGVWVSCTGGLSFPHAPFPLPTRPNRPPYTGVQPSYTA